MATRYLAVLNDGDTPPWPEREFMAPKGFTALFETSALAVLVSEAAECLVLPDGHGVVIGHLFSKGDCPGAVTALSEAESHDIVHSNGTHLVTNYWGGYVAFLANRSSDACHVVRDPSGTLPCLTLEISGGVVVASDIDVLVEAGLLVPRIDYQQLARFLYAFDLRTARTCLAGVSDLLAGFRLTRFHAKTVVTPIWSPWDFVHGAEIQSRAALAARVRQVVQTAVRAWASRFRHILLTVSGGLDSSILAACLYDQPTPVTYLTLATDEAAGDERSYARILAGTLEFPLHEAQYDMADVDIERSSAAHLPRPVLYAFGQGELAARLRLVRVNDIDAMMTGIGGDNVFCSMQSASPIVDRLLTEGPSTGVLETLNDMCRLTGCSVWEAIALAARRALSAQRAYHWEGDASFLSRDLNFSREQRLQHPWLVAPKHALPGKAAHIAKLVRIQGTTDGFCRSATPSQINPLLSQPIVEACLAIPTWAWCAGGRNRSVARAAFQGLLPQALLDRRSKGGPDSFAFDVIDSNRARLRAHLLDGYLARHGLMDVRAVAHALDDRHPIRPVDYMRLSGLAEAEAWVRHWTQKADCIGRS